MSDRFGSNGAGGIRQPVESACRARWRGGQWGGRQDRPSQRRRSARQEARFVAPADSRNPPLPGITNPLPRPPMLNDMLPRSQPLMTSSDSLRAPGGGRAASNRSSTGMNFYTVDSPGLKISPVRPCPEHSCALPRRNMLNGGYNGSADALLGSSEPQQWSFIEPCSVIRQPTC